MTNRRTGSPGTPSPDPARFFARRTRATARVRPLGAPLAVRGFGPVLTPGSVGSSGGTPGRALPAVWILTRSVMLTLLVSDRLGTGGIGREVYVLYRGWYELLRQGAFPVDDPTWQYSPGAAAVLLAPSLLPWLTYFQAVVALTLLADAAITLALVRAGRAGGPGGRAPAAGGTAGAWLWVGGLPLLLHLPLARYRV